MGVFVCVCVNVVHELCYYNLQKKVKFEVYYKCTMYDITGMRLIYMAMQQQSRQNADYKNAKND